MEFALETHRMTSRNAESVVTSAITCSTQVGHALVLKGRIESARIAPGARRNSSWQADGVTEEALSILIIALIALRLVAQLIGFPSHALAERLQTLNAPHV